MISVIIPLYNKEKLIGKTLRSVLEQTYQDFEIVVVNDGSTDNSVTEVEKIADPRIRLIHQQNAGVSVARNKGISEAKGEFIAFLDADDEWNADYLNVQHLLIDKYPQCDVFAANYKFKDLGGKFSETIMRKFPFGDIDGILSNYFEVASCSHPPIWTSAVMVRKAAIQSVGGFPVGIKSGEDLLTWARLACRYKIAYNRTPLAIFAESVSDSDVSKAVQRSGGEQYVLDQLLALYRQYSHVVGLKDFVIRWYKIYCVLSIEIKNNRRILQLAPEAIKFGGNKVQFSILYFLGLLPPAVSKSLFYKLKH